MSAKLKLGPLMDDKPVKVTVELPATLYADLTRYGILLGNAADPPAPVEPARLIVPMLQRFIASDRGFTKAHRAGRSETRKAARES